MPSSDIELIARDDAARILECHGATICRKLGLGFNRASRRVPIKDVAAAFNCSPIWLRNAIGGKDFAVSRRTLQTEYADTLATVLVHGGSVGPVAHIANEPRYSARVLGLIPGRKRKAA